MDKSNKIENLANKYVERHIRDRHLSDDTIKEIKIAYIMIIKDFIAIVDKSTSMNEDDIIYVCTIRKMTKSNGAPRTDSLRNMPAVIGMDGDRLNGRVFQLSPLFVEEMMGYPLMWTTLPFLTGNGEKNQ